MANPDLVIVPVDPSDSGDAPEASDGSSSDGSTSSGSEASSENGSSEHGSSEGESSDDESSSGDSGEENEKKNALEWVVFAMGVAIVLGVIGYLSYQLATETNEPPLLVIELGEQTPRGAVVEIDVTVKNEGDQTAEGATIEVCGGPDTCAELTFPYVPSGSERTGRVGLSTPLAGPLETRAVSFEM